MLLPLDKAILKTLCYADVFDFPLTLAELQKYLIFSKKCSVETVRAALKRLPMVEQKRGYVFLKGREAIVSARQQREKVFKRKLDEVERAKKLLGWIPTVRAIFITGSVAMHNAKDGDDIDFMIVTQTGWLWTTRFVIALLSFMIGKYRNKHSTELKDLWCFNLWLDLSKLRIETSQQNIYTAHETVQAICVLDKEKIGRDFLAQNVWAKKFLPNAIETTEVGEHVSERPTTGNAIEQLFFSLQENHMRNEKTREKTSAHAAFFHPRNTGTMVLGSYEKNLQEYLK